jgi:hypothetical protein
VAVIGGQRNGTQRGGEPGPHDRVAALLEQRGRQQQVDHHPGGELAQPPLGGPAVGQDRIDHLERHDLRQLTQMTRAKTPSATTISRLMTH